MSFSGINEPNDSSESNDIDAKDTSAARIEDTLTLKSCRFAPEDTLRWNNQKFSR